MATVNKQQQAARVSRYAALWLFITIAVVSPAWLVAAGFSFQNDVARYNAIEGLSLHAVPGAPFDPSFICIHNSDENATCDITICAGGKLEYSIQPVMQEKVVPVHGYNRTIYENGTIETQEYFLFNYTTMQIVNYTITNITFTPGPGQAFTRTCAPGHGLFLFVYGSRQWAWHYEFPGNGTLDSVHVPSWDIEHYHWLATGDGVAAGEDRFGADIRHLLIEARRDGPVVELDRVKTFAGYIDCSGCLLFLAVFGALAMALVFITRALDRRVRRGHATFTIEGTVQDNGHVTRPYQLFVDGQEVKFPPGLHRGWGFSPCWGYDGDGPLRLARVILQRVFGRGFANMCCHRFMRGVIAKLSYGKPFKVEIDKATILPVDKEQFELLAQQHVRDRCPHVNVIRGADQDMCDLCHAIIRHEKPALKPSGNEDTSHEPLAVSPRSDDVPNEGRKAGESGPKNEPRGGT